MCISLPSIAPIRVNPDTTMAATELPTRGRYWMSSSSDEMEITISSDATSPASWPAKTVMSVFRDTVRKHGPKVALVSVDDETYTWDRYYGEVRRAAACCWRSS